MRHNCRTTVSTPLGPTLKRSVSAHLEKVEFKRINQSGDLCRKSSVLTEYLCKNITLTSPAAVIILTLKKKKKRLWHGYPFTAQRRRHGTIDKESGLSEVSYKINENARHRLVPDSGCVFGDCQHGPKRLYNSLTAWVNTESTPSRPSSPPSAKLTH